jgi:Glycosyl transferase family 11
MQTTAPTVRVRIVGGLGNQMFGAAAGMALAKRLGAKLEFELYQFRASSAQTLPYELAPFNLPADLSRSRDWRFKPEASLYRWWKRVTAGTGAGAGHVPVLWRQPGHHFDPEFERLSGNVYLKGYFQSERYFANIKAEVRKAFDLSALISEAGRAQAGAAGAVGERSVAVHVRRGDYAQHSDRFALLQRDYYDRALRLVNRAVDRPRYFVVSDDPAAAREMFADRPDTTFAAGGSAFDDMHLIASCHHHIIANSSFSWWGAYLSPWADGLTIAPRAWFSRAVALQTYLDDTYPEGWITV